MATYLERYQNGEHVQVWQELTALGDSVRQEPVYSDAQAVARETMRRARHNIERLVEKLQKLGFEFQQTPFEPPSVQQTEEIDAFEQQIGPVPLSLRAWAEIVGEVSFIGTYPRLSHYEAGINPFFGKAITTGKVSLDDVQNLFKTQMMTGRSQEIDQDFVDDLNDHMRRMLDSMRGAMSSLFGHDLLSDIQEDYQQRLEAPKIPQEDQLVSDPLVVSLAELSVDAFEEWQEMVYEDERDGTYRLPVAPDDLHKSNISGGDPYEIILPNAAADALLLNNRWEPITFVEYLRLAFAWGGFPGLQDEPNRDETLIASLKEGLLPL